MSFTPSRGPAGRTTPEGHIQIYVNIPSLSGYSIKLFTPDMTVRAVIDKLSKSLPVHLRSERYHLFMNGLQILDVDRTLAEARILDKASIELKRAVEYDLKIKPNPDGELICVIPEMDTVEEATKKLCAHAFGEKVYRSQLKNYDFSITNEGLNLQSKFISYKFRRGLFVSRDLRLMLKDIIEVRAVPKNGGNIIYKTLEITYSPITAREEQQSSFYKSGFLRKQGLKNRTWKKRFFVLDTEKLQYFEDERKKKLLGTMYLDELEDCSVNKALTNNGNFYFIMSVPGRVLLMNTKEEKEMTDWIACIKGMAQILHANMQLATVQELEQSKEQRFKTNRLSINTETSTISGPYNPQHLTHITLDFKWEGDISVFKFEELLGKGASGTVYRAKVRNVDFDVAVKKVTSKNPRVQAELEKEIDVLKKCKHPNIVAYYGTKIQGDEVWIIMDYCGVGSAKDVMRTAQETLNEKQVAYVLQNTLKGLAHIHMRNILHLDIKSANILLNDAGEVKLGTFIFGALVSPSADFGVSKTLAAEFVNATNYIGSPLFMAPEVIRKDKYNNKADIWSLGITTIEMAEGMPPNTDIDSIEKLPSLAERPPPVLQDYDKWSPMFHDFIATMLVKEQEFRPNAMDCLAHPFVGFQNVPPRDCLALLIKKANDINQARRLKV